MLQSARVFLFLHFVRAIEINLVSISLPLSLSIENQLRVYDGRFYIRWQVDNLKAKLLENLEHFLSDTQLIPEVEETVSPSSHEVNSVRVLPFCLIFFFPKHMCIDVLLLIILSLFTSNSGQVLNCMSAFHRVIPRFMR